MTYSVRTIVNGFPGKSATHGGFGWSSVGIARSATRTVLIETGPPAYIPLVNEGLANAGITAAEVTDVLITHAHWDHLANFPLFPRAHLWIGNAELRWAAVLPANEPFTSTLHVQRLLDEGDRVGRLNDGDEPIPGIRVIATPGHTPGHLAYEVAGDSSPMIFAGDAVKNLYELATGDVDSTLDRTASRDSVARLRERMRTTGAILVPGHDVPLRLDADSAIRTVPQHAQIDYFGSADGPPTDHSIPGGSGHPAPGGLHTSR